MGTRLRCIELLTQCLRQLLDMTSGLIERMRIALLHRRHTLINDACHFGHLMTHGCPNIV